VNPDGSVSIGGRVDEMIVTGGENVSPAEVERVLESVPGVRRAVVVGLSDPVWGETVGAALEIEPGRLREQDPGANATPDDRARQDLQVAMEERLATFSRPRIVVWMQRLPETPAGKIDRSEVCRRILHETVTGSRVEPSHGA
jgi:O-succinylbenzoic acid--CoA ligase